MSAYEVVRYRSDLRHEVGALQRHLWGGDEAANIAYLEWKYERNPYVSTPMVYLAVHDGRVVGMRGLYGSCWEIGPRAERFLIPCADDFVIAPEHRNHGVFGLIMSAVRGDLAAQGQRIAFSLSAGPTTLAGSLAGGWRSPSSVREVERRSAATSRWRELARRMRRLPIVWRWADMVPERRRRSGAAQFRRLDGRARRAPDGGRVWLSRTPDVDAMAELVGRLGHDGRARQVRDARYLSWRFANPQHEYRFHYAGRAALDGYLVLQAYRRQNRPGVNIVDWEAATPASRAALLRAAVAWGGDADLSAWTISLPEAARALLAEAGFAPAQRGRLMREGPRLLVWVIDGRAGGEPVLAERRLLDVSSWDMRMLYSMAG